MWHKIWRALRNHATEIHNNFSFRVRRYLTAQVERTVLHVSFWCNSNCSHLYLQIFSKRLLWHYMTDKKLGHFHKTDVSYCWSRNTFVKPGVHMYVWGWKRKSYSKDSSNVQDIRKRKLRVSEFSIWGRGVLLILKNSLLLAIWGDVVVKWEDIGHWSCGKASLSRIKTLLTPSCSHASIGNRSFDFCWCNKSLWYSCCIQKTMKDFQHVHNCKAHFCWGESLWPRTIRMHIPFISIMELI